MNLNKQIDFSFITKKTWAPDQFFKIFCYIMFCGICLFLLSLTVFGFERWLYLFFILVDPWDSFMDFYNPISWAGAATLKTAYYNILNLYPPIVVFVTCVLGSGFSEVFSHNMRGGQFLNYHIAIICLLIFLFTSVTSLFSMLWVKKTGNKKTKFLFCFFILFSAPFLHWLERGNYVIFAVIFSLLFVMYYDSSKKYIRHLALLSLALAINIKIYPAVLGLLLLKDKKFKEVFYLGLYTSLWFFVPLIWLGGIDSIFLLSRNLKLNSQNAANGGYGYLLSLSSTLKMLVYAVFRQEYPILNKIFFVLSVFILPVGAFSAYFIKSKWKTLAILCLLMVLIPQISYTYLLLFMIIPLLYFLNEKEKYGFCDLIYLVLFCLIFMLNIPAQAPIFTPGGYPVLMDNFCARLSCLVIFIMLCLDGMKDFILQVKLWKKK